jgi:hypothetical protein
LTRTGTGTGASIQHAAVPIIQDQNATHTRAGMTISFAADVCGSANVIELSRT